MATAGLRVRNDNLVYQVDQDATNFGVVKQGTVQMTLDPTNHPQPMRIGTVSVTGSMPMVAFRANGYAVNLLRQMNSSGQWAFEFRAQANEDFTLHYWIFDDANITQSHIDVGLKVYRADGALAYHSGMKPLRVVGVSNVPTPTEADMWAANPSLGGGFQQTFTPPAGRTWAVIQGSQWDGSTLFESDRDTGGGGTKPPIGGEPGGPVQMTLQTYHASAAVEGDQLIVGAHRSGFFRGNYYSTPEQVHSRGEVRFWIVDVTGY